MQIEDFSLGRTILDRIACSAIALVSPSVCSRGNKTGQLRVSGDD